MVAALKSVRSESRESVTSLRQSFKSPVLRIVYGLRMTGVPGFNSSLPLAHSSFSGALSFHASRVRVRNRGRERTRGMKARVRDSRSRGENDRRFIQENQVARPPEESGLFTHNPDEPEPNKQGSPGLCVPGFNSLLPLTRPHVLPAYPSSSTSPRSFKLFRRRLGPCKSCTCTKTWTGTNTRHESTSTG